MTLERSTRLTHWLAVAALVSPFVWIHIGPQGRAFYGPDVPDIYFLGAIITGKAWTFTPIAGAMIFQLIMVLCFIGCAYLAHRNSRSGAGVRELASVQMVLLLLFPFWLWIYVNGVIDNSDGAAADLRVYPHIGLLVYIRLWQLSINTFVKAGEETASPKVP